MAQKPALALRGDTVTILAPANGSGRDFTGLTGVVERIDDAKLPPIYSVRVAVGKDSLLEYYRPQQINGPNK